MAENGFLTKRDREFLEGKREYTGENARQMRYQVREAIRERTRAAFHDFAFLRKHLDDDELDKIFDPPLDEGRGLEQAIQNTIAFLYQGLEGDPQTPPKFGPQRGVTMSFESAAKEGVRRGEIGRRPPDFTGYPVVDFNVDIVSPPSQKEFPWEAAIEDLAEKNGRGLDEGDLRRLVAHATTDTDRLRELADLIEEHRGGRVSAEDTPFSQSELEGAHRSIREWMEENTGTAEDVDEE